MNGWIVYNGALKFDKITKLVEDMVNKAAAIGIELEMVKNNQLLPLYNKLGGAELLRLVNVKEPQFVIYWDKDTVLARHLERMGYKVFNSSEAIELCDDKALMHMELQKAKLRGIKTIISSFVFFEQRLSKEYIDMIFSVLGDTIILKEAHGSFGMQVYKLDNREELEKKIKELGAKRFILQEYIKTSYGRDIRVNIIGDKVVGAMLRSNEGDFRANITIGGQGTPYVLNAEQEKMALAAHKALNLDFSGVDILFGENEEPILCELNSNVNYMSFEKATGIDYGTKILQHIINRLGE